MMKVCLSLACLPGMHPLDAMQNATDTLSGFSVLKEPLWGALSLDHVQLVPQSQGLLDEALCDRLMHEYPATQFRLHANVRVIPTFKVIDLVDFDRHPQWVEQAARISKRLRAPAYCAHSGNRAGGDMSNMLDNALRAQDVFQTPVAIEGQYPTTGDTLLVSSWSEYRQVFESGLPYAIDLSHLNILVTQSGVREDGLVSEMLNCQRCIEVHVSSNDGSGDWHQVCKESEIFTWWNPLLHFVHDKAVVFTEGNLLRSKRHQPIHKAATQRASVNRTCTTSVALRDR